MPLLDHYRRPLFPTRPPESFLAAWLQGIADVLNVVLPPDYWAEGLPHAGRRWDIDADPREGEDPQIIGGPPPGRAAVPAVLADDAEVRVIGPVNGGMRVVAVVGLVKPTNKRTEAARRAFAAKWASYLSQGVGVALIDIVTTEPADLHRETMALLGHPDAAALTGGAGTYATAYRPVVDRGVPQLHIWTESLAVGSPLPTLPVFLNAVTAVRLDLETTYTSTLVRRRIAG